jgi:RHS repeat-associated protein
MSGESRNLVRRIEVGLFVQSYSYDSLNRLQRVQEGSWQQEFVYDRYGNRTIHQTNTWGTGIPKPDFGVDTASNRLTPPGGYTMSYDAAGNLTNDTYTGQGQRTYDAENRMTGSAGVSPASYTYDADGGRVRRVVNGTETWQVYGIDGELLAEYAANGSPSSPQKEYGYRNGQLLVTVTAAAGGWGSPPTFANNPLVAGETTVQVLHITQLRAAINDLRTHMSLSAYTWQTSATTNDWINAGPILEMRTALDQALGAPSPAYAAGLAPGQPILAIHIQELRNRVLAAWNGGSGSVDIQWLVADQLGTPRMIIDKTGSLAGVKRHDYLPFGEELGANIGGRTTALGYTSDPTRQKFTLKERDIETGLDYFLARYYSNLQGRFTSVDPEQAGAHSDDPQSWNGYAYARNSPLVYSDPFGLDYRVCSPDGKECVTYTDKEFDKLRKGGPQDGYTFKDNKIYYNGDLTATYSNDCLSCEGLINEMAQRTGPIPMATAQFAFVAVVGGASGGVAYYFLAPAADGTVTTLGLGTTGTGATVTEGSLAGLSIQQLSGLIRGTQKQLLERLFGQGIEGAQRALATGEVPAGLTRQALLVYKEIAKRAIEKGIDKGGVQAARLKIIEQALRKIK